VPSGTGELGVAGVDPIPREAVEESLRGSKVIRGAKLSVYAENAQVVVMRARAAFAILAGDAMTGKITLNVTDTVETKLGDELILTNAPSNLVPRVFFAHGQVTGFDSTAVNPRVAFVTWAGTTATAKGYEVCNRTTTIVETPADKVIVFP